MIVFFAVFFVGDGIIFIFWGGRDLGFFNNYIFKFVIIIFNIVVLFNLVIECWILFSNYNSRDNFIFFIKIGFCNFIVIFIFFRIFFIIDFIFSYVILIISY